ncbi:MAG TPA: alkaline phosphatase family protein [Burkholderiaceae bacterium]|nr:alkaline phosphatase family protein [Burkholderiaceae bacterium]
MPKFKVGPVLSFRGVDLSSPQAPRWKVTALLGIPTDTAPFNLLLDGTPTTPPVTLFENADTRIVRYDLSVTLQDAERRVTYALPDDSARWQFTVPAKTLSPRMAYVSCNGYSDPSLMRKLVQPANAVWEDLLRNHDQAFHPDDYRIDKEQLWHLEQSRGREFQRFHVLLMGGDQIYFDSIWDDIEECKQWVKLSRKDQLAFSVSAALDRRIAKYYFDTYCERWLPSKLGYWNGSASKRGLGCADALACIPTVMMWDDHDIFDGWGSYTPEMQQCPLAQTIFKHARAAFWVFQMQHALSALPELRSRVSTNVLIDAPRFESIDWHAHLAADALALPMVNEQPGFSQAYSIGPLALYSADLRTERSRTQILSESSWRAMERWMNDISKTNAQTRHVVVLSSVPVAHPKMPLAEGLFDVFGQDHVLDSSADDIRDHWSHDDHEASRLRLVQLLTKVASEQRVRVQIVSGDVHVAAWGGVTRHDASPEARSLRIEQLTASAVVHPPPSGPVERMFLFYLNKKAEDVQAIGADYTAQMMPFPNHSQRIMPARNWLALEPDSHFDAQRGPRLWAAWRCETTKGFTNHLLAMESVVRDC